MLHMQLLVEALGLNNHHLSKLANRATDFCRVGHVKGHIWQPLEQTSNWEQLPDACSTVGKNPRKVLNVTKRHLAMWVFLCVGAIFSYCKHM